MDIWLRLDNEGVVLVDWDEEQALSFLNGRDNGCSCRKSSCTSCKCSRNKTSCTIRCKCTENCKNPYNKRPSNTAQNVYQEGQSDSDSEDSDTEQVLVEQEIVYDSDEYDNITEI